MGAFRYSTSQIHRLHLLYVARTRPEPDYSAGKSQRAFVFAEWKTKKDFYESNHNPEIN
jgi:hypothetical protein